MNQTSRRDFLKMLCAGTCGAAVHSMFAPLGSSLAFAQMGGGSSVLVVVNLSGGASYNIAPIYNGAYRDRNRTISFGPENSLALSSEQGLHPSLTGLKALADQNSLALINLVGYPNPNRSHAESTDIWQSGLRTSSSIATQGGWGARLSCQLGNAFGGVSLSGSNTFVQGQCPLRTVGNLADFGERSFWGGEAGTEWLRTTRDAVISLEDAPANANHQYVRSAMENLRITTETIKRETNITLPVTFPNTGFGRSCQDAARFLAARSLGTRLMYLELSGFDTHSDERPRLTQLLNELNGGLTALTNCAKALGRWNDLVIVTMSEFCRTFENNSGGTDHGHSAPMLVMGGAVQGGIKSPTPSTAEIEGANGYFHQYHVDFREPFKAITQFMGLDPNQIFPEQINTRNIALF